MKNWNKWKLSFFTILIMNIALLVTIVSFIVATPNTIENSPNNIQTEEVHFNVTTTKQQLNSLIRQYLTKNRKEEKISYAVVLADDITMVGTITAFGKKVSLLMSFEPKVKQNGDLVLEVKAIRLGKLRLPDRTVLKYIKDHYNIPNWVIVQPDKKAVYVSLNSLQLKNNIQLKASTFNLEEDDISFDVGITP
ncbi:YpmS family protein [Lottiidibacillus patelloidae]|nr:YpmS family protein [Lottiidibacillus patelloidae]